MRRAVAVMVAIGTALGAVATVARGDEFPGAGAIAGRAKLKVRSCGKTVDPAALAVVVAADGAWSIDDGTGALVGTGTILGKAGRKLVLTPDEASMAALTARLEADASTLCGTSVLATDVTMRKAVLKVNPKGSRARLVVVLGATGSAGDGTSGKAKFRVRAAGPWTGPLSCEEVFVCTRTCAQDDTACVDDCLAHGTLETQVDVTALNACLATACPLADPVCVEAALAGECRDVYETCVPPPPPSNLTCEEIFDCTAECGGQRCVDDCFDRGSDRGRDEATAVAGCVNRVCPAGGASCQASALAGACAAAWEACTGTPPPRNLSCGAILDCLGTCAAGDAACAGDCRDRGSAIGTFELATLESCVDAACPTRAPACVADTVTGQCQAQWNACLG